MLEVLAARNYFETHGSFTEIRHDLGKRVANMSEDDLYASIGFLPYKDFSGKQVFMIRKLYLHGDVEQAMEKSGCSTPKELKTFIEKSYNRVLPAEEYELLRYAELLTVYITNVMLPIMEENPETVGGLETFRDDCTRNRKKKTPLAVSKDSKKFFDDVYNVVKPNIRVVEGIEPKIVEGTMFIPRELSKKEMKLILEFVLENFIMGVVEVPGRIVNMYKNIAIGFNFTDLLDSEDVKQRDLYTTILDFAIRKGTTVEEVLLSMGFNLIQYWRQYKESKCMYILKNENFVLVKFEDRMETVDLVTFLQLYKNDNLLSYKG